MYNSDKYVNLVDAAAISEHLIATTQKHSTYNHQKYARGPVPPGYDSKHGNSSVNDKLRGKSDSTKQPSEKLMMSFPNKKDYNKVIAYNNEKTRWLHENLNQQNFPVF